MIKLKFVALFVLLLTCQRHSIHASPAISEIDRVRLGETFRIGDRLGDQIWRGWSKAPFAVLLVTPEY